MFSLVGWADADDDHPAQVDILASFLEHLERGIEGCSVFYITDEEE